MTFSAKEQDCLIELMNMAYGATASAVADTIDAFTTLHVPQLFLLEHKQLLGHFSKHLDHNTAHYVSSQQFHGELDGEVLFILGQESAANLVKHLDGSEAESDNEMADAVMELCNIITASTMKNLADSLHPNIDLQPPKQQKIFGKEIDTIEGLDKYQHLIVISTVMEFQEQQINGELMVLCQDDTLDWLRAAVNKVIDELGY